MSAMLTNTWFDAVTTNFAVIPLDGISSQQSPGFLLQHASHQLDGTKNNVGRNDRSFAEFSSIRRREHGAKEAKTLHTEECGDGSSGSRGKRQGGTGTEGRKTQKPKSFCAASTALTGVMPRTATAKRARHQNFVRRRVRHLHRLKPAERSGGSKGTNAGPQRRSAIEGPWSRSGTTVHLEWAGLVPGLITEGTKLGEVLAPLS